MGKSRTVHGAMREQLDKFISESGVTRPTLDSFIRSKKVLAYFATARIGILDYKFNNICTLCLKHHFFSENTKQHIQVECAVSAQNTLITTLHRLYPDYDIEEREQLVGAYLALLDRLSEEGYVKRVKCFSLENMLVLLFSGTNDRGTPTEYVTFIDVFKNDNVPQSAKDANALLLKYFRYVQQGK